MILIQLYGIESFKLNRMHNLTHLWGGKWELAWKGLATFQFQCSYP